METTLPAPRHTLDPPTTDTLAQLLADAATLIERDGLHQGGYWDGDLLFDYRAGVALDAVGALAVVAGHTRTETVEVEFLGLSRRGHPRARRRAGAARAPATALDRGPVRLVRRPDRRRGRRRDADRRGDGPDRSAVVIPDEILEFAPTPWTADIAYPEQVRDARGRAVFAVVGEHTSSEQDAELAGFLIGVINALGGGS
jgi:hypothetical protein